MGLDMYAYTRQTKPEKPVDFAIDADEEQSGDYQIAYWRKHPNLHGWMKDLYREKGGTDADFNCVPVELTPKDIDRLEAAINGNTLPQTDGFFFGASSPEDKADYLAFIKKARERLAEGEFVYYSAWW